MANSASYTNNSSIYSKTKWGSLPIKPLDAIIANRNSFVKDYSIKALLVTPAVLTPSGPFAGEVECYSTKDNGRVVVVSLLDWRVDMIGPLTKLYKFEKHAPLYSMGHVSLVRVFKTRKEYDAFVKSIQDKK